MEAQLGKEKRRWECSGESFVTLSGFSGSLANTLTGEPQVGHTVAKKRMESWTHG